MEEEDKSCLMSCLNDSQIYSRTALSLARKISTIFTILYAPAPLLAAREGIGNSRIFSRNGELCMKINMVNKENK